MVNPADMIQDEHDDDSGTKRILMYGVTTGSEVVPVLLDNNGLFGYLKLDGSNANTTINIGSQNFTTTGEIRGDTIKVDHIAEKEVGHGIVLDNDLKAINDRVKIDLSNADTEEGGGFVGPIREQPTFSQGVELKALYYSDASFFPSGDNVIDLGRDGSGLGVASKWKDLHLSGDANIGGDANVTEAITGKTLTITDPVVPWKFMKTQINTGTNTELAIQSQTSGAATRLGLYSKDILGGNNVFFHIYASGSPEDRTGENRIDIGYDKILDKYVLNAGKELFIDGFGGLHLSDNGELTTIGGDVILPDGDLKVRRSKITKAGGFGILLMNSSVSTIDANHLVMASTSESNSFDLTVINALNAIGVTEISVDSEEEEFIITTGMHFVMIDGEFTFGDRLITSSTNEGHAEVNNNPAVAVHFQEIGHCLESGENEIGNVALHFN